MRPEGMNCFPMSSDHCDQFILCSFLQLSIDFLLKDGAKSAFLYSRGSGNCRCIRYDLPEVECRRLRAESRLWMNRSYQK